MGQKIHPLGFRLRITQDHRSSWFADKKNYPSILEEDYKIRTHINKDLGSAGISKIEINRKSDQIELEIHTSRPGIIVGRSGSGIEKLKEDLTKIVATDSKIRINVTELKNMDADANLIGEFIAQQLEKRVAFKRSPFCPSALLPFHIFSLSSFLPSFRPFSRGFAPSFLP